MHVAPLDLSTFSLVGKTHTTGPGVPWAGSGVDPEHVHSQSWASVESWKCSWQPGLQGRHHQHTYMHTCRLTVGLSFFSDGADWNTPKKYRHVLPSARLVSRFSVHTYTHTLHSYFSSGAVDFKIRIQTSDYQDFRVYVRLPPDLVLRFQVGTSCCVRCGIHEVFRNGTSCLLLFVPFGLHTQMRIYIVHSYIHTFVF